MENNCTSFLEMRFETFILKELTECINRALILDSFTMSYVIIILLWMISIGEVRVAPFVTIQPRVELAT